MPPWVRTGNASHANALRQDTVTTTKSTRTPSNGANLQLGEAAAEKASSTAAALSDALAHNGNTALAANVCTVARSLESQLCGNDGGTAALASEKDCSGSQGVSEEDAEELARVASHKRAAAAAAQQRMQDAAAKLEAAELADPHSGWYRQRHWHRR